MKKIITIDMDIIMGPCISLYNNNVYPDHWNNSLQNPYLQLCQIDNVIMQKLITYIFNCAQVMNSEDIYFIFDHDQILDLIDTNEKYSVINIDHHHDLGYQNFYDNITCGNWVYFMHKNNNLNNYMWIKNINSDMSLTDEQKKLLTVTIPIDNAEQLMHNNIPDKLFICLSPDFVPPMYQTWFYWILDTLNEKYNYKFTVFKRICECNEKTEN